MSSSKVFKRPQGFVPEKIVTTTVSRQESGWKSVTFSSQAKQQEPVAYRRENADDTPLPIDRREENPRIEPIETAPASDFSAPEPSPVPEAAEKTEIEAVPELPDIERIKEEAYAQGVRDGRSQAEEDFGAGVKALMMACEQINSLRETILHNSMDEMQDLVLIIAEKIIRHSVTEQDRTIVDTVKEAIHQAVKSDEFAIQVNPADLDVIRSKSQEFIDSLSGLEHVIVQADPTVDRGGCRIDASTSTVDATVASQLQIIKNTLKGTT